MSANILRGILIVAIVAFFSGSFSNPFYKVTRWKCENSWLTIRLFTHLILPLILCLMVSLNFMEMFLTVPVSNLLLIFILGAVYGLANLTFTLSLRHLIETLKGAKANVDFNLRKRLFAALFADIIGSSMSLGFEQGKKIAVEAV